MQQETIRLLDRWGGKFICALLTLHRRFLSLLLKNRSAEPTERILFLKLIEQGATVLAYSALKRAVEMVGEKNLYFLVFAENRPILDLMEIIPRENVITIRRDHFHYFLWDTLKALWFCRRMGIDTTVDMEFFARASAIIAYLTGARKRVGLHRFTSEGPYRGDLMTHRVQYNPHLHTAISYRSLVEAISYDPSDIPLLKVNVSQWLEETPHFQPRAEEQAKVEALLETLGSRGARPPLVLLNPNASDLMPLRKWPTERFIALGKSLLAAQKEITLVITGAPAEAESAQKIATELGSERVVSVAGKTSLRELFVLYTMADILVTNDSGPAHFSSMTDIHSVVLFGPETPKLFGALSPKSQVISAGLACSPCVNVFNHRFSPCTNNRCMQEISVEDVFAKVQAILWNEYGRPSETRVKYRSWSEKLRDLPAEESPEIRRPEIHPRFQAEHLRSDL